MAKHTDVLTPFRYEPSGDSDGFTIGMDHFVLDAGGNELACPPNEEIARMFAASWELLKALRRWENASQCRQYIPDREKADWDDLMAETCAAIAKAEGTSEIS